MTIESLHGSNLTTAAEGARMTPHEPDPGAALAAIGLGFELEPGAGDALDGAEVLALRDAAAFLAYAPAPVRPGTAQWRRLLDAMGDPVPLARARARRRPMLGLILAGAGVLAAAAALVVALRALDARDDWRRQARRAERSAALVGEELRATRAEQARQGEELHGAEATLATVRAPELQVASFHGERAGKARVMMDPDSRRWLVVAFELPAIDDRDYQLWLVPEGGAPISAGLLHRRADGVLEMTGTVPSTITSFRPAISLEPRGGSPAPTQIQMVGEPL